MAEFDVVLLRTATVAKLYPKSVGMTDGQSPMVFLKPKKRSGPFSLLELVYDDDGRIVQESYNDGDDKGMVTTLMYYYTLRRLMNPDPKIKDRYSIAQLFPKLNQKYQKWHIFAEEGVFVEESRCNFCREGVWSVKVEAGKAEPQVEVSPFHDGNHSDDDTENDYSVHPM